MSQKPQASGMYWKFIHDFPLIWDLQFSSYLLNWPLSLDKLTDLASSEEDRYSFKLPNSLAVNLLILTAPIHKMSYVSTQQFLVEYLWEGEIWSKKR